MEELIEAVVNGKDVGEVLDEYMKGTIRRPRRRRFARKGKRFDPYTGKRKDPRKMRKARRVARKFRAKRKVAARKLARSGVGKAGARRRGKLISRLHRQGRIRSSR
jgi:hypothetical protein